MLAQHSPDIRRCEFAVTNHALLSRKADLDCPTKRNCTRMAMNFAPLEGAPIVIGYISTTYDDLGFARETQGLSSRKLTGKVELLYPHYPEICPFRLGGLCRLAESGQASQGEPV